MYEQLDNGILDTPAVSPRLARGEDRSSSFSFSLSLSLLFGIRSSSLYSPPLLVCRHVRTFLRELTTLLRGILHTVIVKVSRKSYLVSDP